MTLTRPAKLLKFGTAFAITFAICWAVPHVFDDIPDFPLINTDRAHFRIINHYFQSPTPWIAMAGSSLTARLKEHYFERRDIRNLGLGGGSPLTGLTVLAETSWKRPAVVAVEINIMSRSVDRELVREFHQVDRPIATFASFRTLLALNQRRMDGPPPAFDPARCAGIFRSPPAQSLVNHDDTASIRIEYENPAVVDPIRNNVAALKALVKELETGGVKVYVFELPTLPALEATGYVQTTRSAVLEYFGPDRWLDLKYPADELRWDDAVHFDDRSAIILACSLERALNSKLRP
jgi:hypothetical protein